MARTPFLSAKLDTVTEPAFSAIVAKLASEDWTQVLQAIESAGSWLAAAQAGRPDASELVLQLARLAAHPKWEIRRAVANLAAQNRSDAFGDALARLATDDNSRVRQAAASATTRRRDWADASALGRQHVDRANTMLEQIESRFGIQARDAVRRTAEQMANTFVRELYHEMIKLVTPLASSADRLRESLEGRSDAKLDPAREAARIETRVAHLKSVLNAMRSYTETPELSFERTPIAQVVDLAVANLTDDARGSGPGFDVQVDPSIVAEICGPRLVQALTNLLYNAAESYLPKRHLKPVVVRASARDGYVELVVEDFGAGMSAEVLADAPVLFSTSKANGTGFGLPLAIKIVEHEHDGRLAISSEEGVGTSIRISLPSSRNWGSR